MNSQFETSREWAGKSRVLTLEPERRRKSIESGIILFNIQYEWIFCSLLAFVTAFSGLGKKQLAKYLSVIHIEQDI